FALEVASFTQQAEKLVEVHITVTNLQVLVHAHCITWWVGDITQAVGFVMVKRIRQVHSTQAVTEGSNNPLGLIAHAKAVRSDVDKPNLFGVQASDHTPCFYPIFHEIIPLRVNVELNPLTFQNRQQLFHGAVETSFGFLRAFWAAREFRVDGVDFQVNCNLDDAFEVANRSHP